MAKESALTVAEKDSIEIERLIFHIIVQSGIEYRPEYFDELEITPDQVKFFKEQLKSVSQGTQMIFVEKETSSVYTLSKSIVDDSNTNFVSASKQLAADFLKLHNKSTNPGVFVIALTKIQAERRLVFLLKLDHKKVYEYKRKHNRALLEEVKNTFVEDKTAIQKVALIDISDYYAWDVLAYDRVKPTLTDYFIKYLSVEPRETPAKLTQKAISLTREWAAANKGIIDSSQEVSSYKNRAIAYLSEKEHFDTEQFIDFVIYDEDLSRKQQLKDSFNDFLIEKGLAGQVFVPSKGTISKNTKKNVRQTAEGVKIEWTGEAKDNNIIIPQARNEADGLFYITIKTSEVINIQ